jgi:hypothetical protein
MKCFAASKKAGHVPALNDGFWPIVLKKSVLRTARILAAENAFSVRSLFVSIADH